MRSKRSGFVPEIQEHMNSTHRYTRWEDVGIHLHYFLSSHILEFKTENSKFDYLLYNRIFSNKHAIISSSIQNSYSPA